MIEKYPYTRPVRVTEGPFSWDGAELSYGGSRRFVTSTLRNALRSSEKYSRQWFSAQLRLYGINAPVNASKQRLMHEMQTALQNGLCNAPSDEMRSVEASLKHKFDEAQISYEKDKAQWEHDQFESLQGDHAKEVAADPERFLTKYFFESDRADPNRSQPPITIIGRHFTTLQPRITKMFGARDAPIVYDGVNITLVGWQQDMPDAIGEAFLKVSSQMSRAEDIAIAEANIDVKKFLVKYFGFEPDGSLKTGNLSAKPVTLCGFLKSPHEFSAITLRTPKFVIKNVSDSTHAFTRDIYIVGWKSDVDREVQRIEYENERIKHEKKRKLALQHEVAWQNVLTSYAADMAQCTPHHGPLEEEQLVGTYIVRFDAESKPGEINLLTVNNDGGVILDLGIITAELTFCSGWIGAAPGKNEKSPWEQCEEECYDEEQEEEEEEEEQDYRYEENESAVNSASCSIDPRWLKAAPKGLLEDGINRIHFRYTYEPEMNPIDEQLAYDIWNSGYLDFGTSKLSAQGHIWLGFSDSWAEISVLKISDTVSPKR